MNGHIPPVRERAGNALRSVVERLSPRQRQYGLLGLILVGGVGLLWLILALTSAPTHPTDVAQRQDQPGSVTNIGVMPPGTGQSGGPMGRHRGPPARTVRSGAR